MSVNAVNSDGSLLRVAGGTLYADSPIGTISPFGGSAIPSGYLLCNGQEVSRTTYAALFAVIGVAFGSGDGSTTFNLPDLREAVPKGAGLTGKTVGAHLDADGLAVGEFLDDRLQDYFAGGDLPTYIGGESGAVNLGDGNYGYYVGNQRRELKATRRGATTEVKAVGVNYIIKAKQVAVPFDVAEYIRNQNVLSDYETASSSFTAEYDGFITAKVGGTGQGVEIKINGVSIARNTNADYGINGVSALFKKGDVVLTSDPAPKVCYYKLRDYSGR